MGERQGTGTGLCFPELLIVGVLLAVLGVAGAARYQQADAESDYARILGNFRAVAVALDAYKVDTGQVPETDTGGFSARSILRLTTPVAYLTSLPVSPYDETAYWGPSSSRVVARTNSLFYVRKYYSNPAIIDSNFTNDVVAYYFQGALVSPQVRNEFIAANDWEMVSVGPDGIDDRMNTAPGYGINARVYDPTNGALSRGNVVWFSAYRVPQAQPVYTTWRTY
jgi:type II secretory pathway pseudopilin PulG